MSFRTLHCVLVSAKYRNSSFPPRNTSAGDCAPCASLPMPVCQGDFGGHLERLRGWNFSLSSISNLSEHGEFLIWSLLLEKFQPLRLSYDRKPEPGTPDSRARCKMRKLKPSIYLNSSSLSSISVKGPSFKSSTFISAPNCPFSTTSACSRHRARKCS